MNLFKTILINEIERILKRKKLVLIFSISFFTIIIGQILILFIREKLGIRPVDGVGFTLLILDFIIKIVLPLLVLLLSIDSFSSEYSKNLIKITLLKPISRKKIYFAKFVSIALLIFMSLIIFCVFSILFAFIFNDAFNVLIEIRRIIFYYIITIVPFLALISMSIFVCNILKSSSIIFFISILLFIVIQSMGFIVRNYSNISILNYLNWYVMFLRYGNLYYAISKISLILGYLITFYSAGLYLFEKKEF